MHFLKLNRYSVRSASMLFLSGLTAVVFLAMIVTLATKSASAGLTTLGIGLSTTAMLSYLATITVEGNGRNIMDDVRVTAAINHGKRIWKETVVLVCAGMLPPMMVTLASAEVNATYFTAFGLGFAFANAMTFTMPFIMRLFGAIKN